MGLEDRISSRVESAATISAFWKAACCSNEVDVGDLTGDPRWTGFAA